MKSILDTARLRLRELVPDDLEFMAGMLADADVMRHYPKRLTRELSAEWIERQRARYASDGYGLWLAESRETGQPVGQIGLVKQTVNGAEECEVGYLIHKEYWRHGFATEGALACRDHAFNVLGKARVIALVRPENAASQGVAQNLGMEVVGRAPHGGYEHLVFAVAAPGAPRTGPS
ncbi:MAG: GNAT family N-acetyltransferase [Acidobacteriota bacterium]